MIPPFMCVIDLRRQKACAMHCVFIFKTYILHKEYAAPLVASAATEPMQKEPDKTDSRIPAQVYLPLGTLSLAMTVSPFCSLAMTVSPFRSGVTGLSQVFLPSLRLQVALTHSLCPHF